MINNNDKPFAGSNCINTDNYHHLTDIQRKILIENGNTAQTWDTIMVHDDFDPRFVYHCRFIGEIFIGALKEGYLEYRSITVPIGLYNSTFFNCSIGHYPSINNLQFCSNCTIGSEVIILNTGDISNSHSPRFGNGISNTKGESTQYYWLKLINENGGRKVLPFDSILCTDAFLWVRYPHDKQFIQRLIDITDNTCAERACGKGMIGNEAVIINAKSIRDTWVGNNAIIDGTESIINSTIRSDDLEPAVIGAGVIISDSVVGYGNQIDTGAQLHTVVTGNCVSCSHVCRISHSLIGDNSAIACCEIAHSFIFPSHGQHHNNSFLIAALIGGQSNIAAGATIGSNHNSRMNDGEIWASRGFWPGLCTSFKHNSKFAAYTMCVKADYPYELDIPFPFSLIINDPSSDSLQILPAYWFSHNMYALMRSRLKFGNRDKRIHREQIIEHDPLAPDTIEQIFDAIRFLEETAGQLWFKISNIENKSLEECQKKGWELFESGTYFPEHFEVRNCIEKGNRPVLIIKPAQARQQYLDIICWYAVKTLMSHPEIDKIDLTTHFTPTRDRHWVNCGGQIMRTEDLSSIIERIKNDTAIKTWNDIHQLYQSHQNNYESLKIHHAVACLFYLSPQIKETHELFKKMLKKAVKISEKIIELTKTVRAKDYTEHFRTMIFENEEEMQSVIGTVDDDVTIRDVEEDNRTLIEKINRILNTLE